MKKDAKNLKGFKSRGNDVYYNIIKSKKVSKIIKEKQKLIYRYFCTGVNLMEAIPRLIAPFTRYVKLNIKKQPL